MTAPEDWFELVDRLWNELELRQERTRSDEGPESPWTELRRRLHRIASLLASPEDADDVVQTVLLKLQSAEALERLRASRSPQGYLVVMVRHAAIDAVRRRASLAADMEQPLPQLDAPPSPEELLTRESRAYEVQNVVNELAESDRRLLMLRFWDDLSMVEIARRLDLPYSTVAVRMFRLLRRLRDRMPGRR